MSRFFDGKEVELLAPAGTFEIFKRMVQSGADAIYCGGKKLNMRIHRKEYNLTDDELREAVEMSHSMGKKLYITLNNLYDYRDLEEAAIFLEFLNELQPDAVLIQDFSIVEMIRKMNLNLNLHSSVMMNIHNLESVKEVQRLGITRVVTSREMELSTIKALKAQTGMEFEYFVHGDMCIAHGSQCLYSGIIFGKSGNRGMCMKPCRWGYSMKKDGKVYPTEYPMAMKDMYMYENIPELIDAGVTSFKVEGRMREMDYLMRLVDCYSDAIDRYIEDPIGYDRKKRAGELYEHRMRDFTTSFAFGNPGLSGINRRYEGTGYFYSTGKVFSNPVEEMEIASERTLKLKELLKTEEKSAGKPLLAVKVNSFAQAEAAIREGADRIYLSGDVYEPDVPFTKGDVARLAEMKGSADLFLGMPRMMYEGDFSRYRHFIKENQNYLDGLLVTNLGALKAFKGYGLPLAGDFSMNVYNSLAAGFYGARGLSTATASLESPATNTRQLVKDSPIPVELVVHGLPAVMYMEHDLYENTRVLSETGLEGNFHVEDNVLILKDDKGAEHPVYRDWAGRNHMTLYKELCLLPVLGELCSLGTSLIRIEACGYSTEALQRVLKTYKKALEDLQDCQRLFDSMKRERAGFTFGAFNFD